MSKGQWRVLALEAVLLGLEILRSPAVKSFFANLINTPISPGSFSQGTKKTAAQKTSPVAQSTQQQQINRLIQINQ
jgi:hypothetical protein